MAKIIFEKLITTTEKMEVVGTGIIKHLKKGEVYLMHPIRAERFIKNGWAVKAEPKKKVK